MKRLSIAIAATLLVISLLFGCSSPQAAPAPTAATAAKPVPTSNGGASLPVSNQNPVAPTDGGIDPNWAAPKQSLGSPLPDMVTVVAKVKPSVVAINDQVTTATTSGRSRGQTPQVAVASGSGWIIDSSGLIVTNDHVVSGAQNIVVTLNDGRNFPAVKVVTDPVNDLAVIKIDATGLPAANAGDSSRLQLGMPVMAIGNALGEGIRVTSGIVSNLGTSITLSATQTLYDLVETDAAINPGNSGGALVNMNGEVVGIVNAKVSASGVEGMGYAIAANTALPILQQLVTQGYVVRPWIGAVFQTVDPGVAAYYNLSVQNGVLVTDVAASSPADAAGMQQNDVIVAINDKNVTTASQLASEVSASQIGQKVTLTYWRGNSKSSVEVVPIQNPTP